MSFLYESWSFPYFAKKWKKKSLNCYNLLHAIVCNEKFSLNNISLELYFVENYCSLSPSDCVRACVCFCTRKLCMWFYITVSQLNGKLVVLVVRWFWRRCTRKYCHLKQREQENIYDRKNAISHTYIFKFSRINGNVISSCATSWCRTPFASTAHWNDLLMNLMRTHFRQTRLKYLFELPVCHTTCHTPSTFLFFYIRFRCVWLPYSIYRTMQYIYTYIGECRYAHPFSCVWQAFYA